MTEPTLESLADRIAALERKLVVKPTGEGAQYDWRSIVGMMDDNEFTREWIAEMEAIREADREAARQGQPETKP